MSIHPKLEGFDPQSIERLASLLQPLPQMNGYLTKVLWIVVDEAGRPLHAFDTKRNALKAPANLDDLANFAKSNNASVVLAGPQEVVEALIERWENLLPQNDVIDILARSLFLLRNFVDEIDRGALRVWPPYLAFAPVPSAQNVERALDSLWPKQSVALLGLWDEEKLWLSCAAQREESSRTTMWGPQEIDTWLGPMGGEWRRDYAHLLERVTQKLGPVQAGFFAERKTLLALLESRDPWQWLKAIAARDVIIEPFPVTELLNLGVDMTWNKVREGLKPLWDLFTRTA